MEIERKFLIENMEEIDIDKYPRKRYVQGYISTSPTIRLRNEGGKCVLCIKSGGGLSREEFELEINNEQFNRLWKKIEANAVVKDRYFIPIDGGLTAELDVYFDALDGLVTVEVEFATESDAKSFNPPKWFGRDVTFNSKYKNASLARYGLPAE